MARPALATVLLALAASACTRPGVATYPQASVVLVSIDTLRADHLALYGYGKGRTPRLDALGREAVVFDDVYSHVPLTLPAHASLFTGLLPPKHEVRDNMGFQLKATHPTLAERFKAAGLATGGAVSAYVLRGPTGISRGFDFYEDALTIDTAKGSLGDLQRDGAVAVDALARWIEALGGKRFFAFLHLYEPHSPYAPPERHRDLALPYDGEVAYADELLGRFLDRLKAAGLLEKAIFAVTSDHGEGLLRPRRAGAWRVSLSGGRPRALRAAAPRGRPRREAGQAGRWPRSTSRSPFSTSPGRKPRAWTAVAPRGAPIGRSRGAPRLLRDPLPALPLRVERALCRERGPLPLHPGAAARALRPRRPTRERRTNLAGERASAVASMGEWLGSMVGGVTAPEAVDAETREKLAALGYVGGSAAALTAGNLPDPKDKIGTYENWKHAVALRQAGRNAEAVEQLRVVVAENPRMTDAWETLGLTLIKLGREQEGIAALEKVIEIDPTRPDPHMALAKLYALSGKLDRATRHAEIAAGREPGKSFEILAQILMDERRAADAVAFARKSLAADPSRMMSHFILGVVARQQGRCEEAVAAFQRAAEAKAREKGTLLQKPPLPDGGLPRAHGAHRRGRARVPARARGAARVGRGPRRPGDALQVAGQRRAGPRRTRGPRVGGAGADGGDLLDRRPHPLGAGRSGGRPLMGRTRQGKIPGRSPLPYVSSSTMDLQALDDPCELD